MSELQGTHPCLEGKGKLVEWHAKRDLYMAVLSNEGYRPEVDKDGDVHFKYEGGNFYILANEDDTFFHVIYPAFWSIDDGAESRRALVAASAASRATKVAKIFVNRELTQTFAAAEVFVSRPEDVNKYILGRCLSCIRSAVNTFGEEMRAVSVA